MNPVWTDERIAELERLAEEGASLTEAARHLGVSFAAVAGAAKRHGIRFSPRRFWRISELQVMHEMRKAGRTWAEIARWFDTTPNRARAAYSRWKRAKERIAYSEAIDRDQLANAIRRFISEGNEDIAKALYQAHLEWRRRRGLKPYAWEEVAAGA